MNDQMPGDLGQVDTVTPTVQTSAVFSKQSKPSGGSSSFPIIIRMLQLQLLHPKPERSIYDEAQPAWDPNAKQEADEVDSTFLLVAEL